MTPFYVAHLVPYNAAAKCVVSEMIGECPSDSTAARQLLNPTPMCLCDAYGKHMEGGLHIASAIPAALSCYSLQGDHSPDNVKFPDNSLMVRSTPLWHSTRLISCPY